MRTLINSWVELLSVLSFVNALASSSATLVAERGSLPALLLGALKTCIICWYSAWCVGCLIHGLKVGPAIRPLAFVALACGVCVWCWVLVFFLLLAVRSHK